MSTACAGARHKGWFSLTLIVLVNDDFQLSPKSHKVCFVLLSCWFAGFDLPCHQFNVYVRGDLIVSQGIIW